MIFNISLGDKPFLPLFMINKYIARRLSCDNPERVFAAN